MHACPVDCVVSAWGNWTDCDKSCGGGNTLEARSVIVGSANAGNSCPGGDKHVVVDQCNIHHCPIDCVLSEWSEWGMCKLACDGGYRLRYRVILFSMGYGGSACGQMWEEEPCNTHPCPVDCAVSAWTEWSECTVSCGGGVTSQTREVIRAQAYDGISCPGGGNHTNVNACNAHSCPVDCILSEWGEWAICKAACGSSTRQQLRSVITHANYGGAACPSSVQQEPCNTHLCPLDCLVSDWNAWTACSTTCGGGFTSMSRSVIQTMANGGIICSGGDIHMVTIACNTFSCPTPAPTPYPTDSPTIYPTNLPTNLPTPAPTTHHCTAGTHFCWISRHDPPAACVQLQGESYACECPYGYAQIRPHVSHASELKHACAKTPSPTAYPTAAPTAYPTESPTAYPTKAPSTNPTNLPTTYPTPYPSNCPTTAPTGHHCTAGTHYCWRNTAANALCIVLNGENYSCECPIGFATVQHHISHDAELKHECEKTPAPTAYPTPSPTVTTCILGVTYELVPPTSASDRVCVPVRGPCGIHEYESAAPDLINNRACKPLTECEYLTEFEIIPPGSTNDRQCSAVSICNITAEYESTATTNASDRSCTALTICGESDFETIVPDATTNRKCQHLSLCVNRVSYQTVAPTGTSDRSCKPVKQCTPPSVMLVPPTLSTDTVCAEHCSSSEYEGTHAAYSYLHRKVAAAVNCKSLTTCNTSSQYQEAAPTISSNRVCHDLTVCTPNEQELTTPTYWSNRVCSEPMDVTPILNVFGGDIITLAASLTAQYTDRGAVCHDAYCGYAHIQTASGNTLAEACDISENVVIAGDRWPELGSPGTYTVKYNCRGTTGGAAGLDAIPAQRKVIVVDSVCPACKVRSGPSVVEASFPYADAGADCTDNIDGAIASVDTIGTVDVEQVGTYLITYRAHDSSGNWNDGHGATDLTPVTTASIKRSCLHASSTVRTVVVRDTIQPVIALAYGGSNFQRGSPGNLGLGGEPNPTIHAPQPHVYSILHPVRRLLAAVSAGRSGEEAGGGAHQLMPAAAMFMTLLVLLAMGVLFTTRQLAVGSGVGSGPTDIATEQGGLVHSACRSTLLPSLSPTHARR
jgi:hypothetical protein